MANACLFVEGQGDVQFFKALFRRLDADKRIDIKPPSALAPRLGDTVSHFPSLISMLVKSLEDGRLEQLGIIADADYTSGGGFESRWNTLGGCLKEHGFNIPKKPPKLADAGSIFKHADGLPSVGLYLMPNHRDNGMLEDLLWQGLKHEPEGQALQRYAEKTIKALPHTRFSKHHHTKALLYTWLAWQKRPGQTMDVTINAKLLDYELDALKGFLNWLARVFPFLKNSHHLLGGG